jgi:uncharacterized membrane protein YccC
MTEIADVLLCWLLSTFACASVYFAVAAVTNNPIIGAAGAVVTVLFLSSLSADGGPNDGK